MPARDPEGKAAMVRQGVDAGPGAPEALAARIRDELGKWREPIKKADIKPE
jgi:tripartite-type tricarboxylate transporter receptor subunit TctC